MQPTWRDLPGNIVLSTALLTPFRKDYERASATVPAVKAAGMVFVAVAVLLLAGFWLVPVEFTVLGTSVSCGTPIANTSPSHLVGSDIEKSVLAECGDRNHQRVVIGLVLGVIAIVAGLLMLRAADTSETAAIIAAGGTVAARSSPGRWVMRIGIKVLVAFAAVIVLVVILALL